MQDKKNQIYDDPRKIIASALVEAGDINEDVVYISCDSSLGASGDPFRKNIPKGILNLVLPKQLPWGRQQDYQFPEKCHLLLHTFLL